MTERVWYRSIEGSRIEDRGTLTVAGGAIWFSGRKGTTVGGPVRAVLSRPHGFTNWVVVTYEQAGERREGYFVCSQLLGWAGILGANRKLQGAIEDEIQAPA